MSRAVFPVSTVLGYPRIGPRRELKRAVEAYWAGRCDHARLLDAGRELRRATWRRLAAAGLGAGAAGAVPSNTFSSYDHVLDTALLLDAVPDRYRRGTDEDTAFAMARGDDGVSPLPMTKWFDTNYHHLVPEIGEDTPLRLHADKPLGEVHEAAELGIATRPVLVGPITFLTLAQSAPGAPAAFRPLHRLDDVLDVYARLLGELAAAGVEWVQLDEPALVCDRDEAELAATAAAYRRLGDIDRRPALFVASYFGGLGDALPVLADTPVEAVGVDLVRGDTAGLSALTDKTVVAGLVSGRSVWRTDLPAARGVLRALRDRLGRVTVSTSCSLLHVPYDVAAERDLDPALRDRLAFAVQKVDEVVALADHTGASTTPVTGSSATDTRQPGTLTTSDGHRPSGTPSGRDGSVPPTPNAHPPYAPGTAHAAAVSDNGLAAGSFTAADGHSTAGSRAPARAGRAPYPVRAAAQAQRLRLPALPTTTIGSFPQTAQLRAARASVAAGQLSTQDYDDLVRGEIEHAIRLQERIGLDVLVHGEPERNDMVQYFAERLDGFAVTRNGWVQSYGSRCTRPPILHADVARTEPITVDWWRYAQSLTDRPVKGMLTGPVTIAAWSFLRDDRPVRQLVDQIADALRAEVADLDAAGAAVIQVDEPALREMLPLRAARRSEYLDWAVAAYRWATSGASTGTQVHTHLCYSDAAQVVSAIDALDADVTTIESARSEAAILSEPAVRSFGRGLGPGVYDIHSPRVPSADEIGALLRRLLAELGPDRLWVNPDCGLKTRSYSQIEAALTHLVTATHTARDAPAPA